MERAQLVLADWQHTRRRLDDVERRMVDVLDELGLTGLVTSIHGLTAVGAATLLAKTGDLTRFDSQPAVVKHAGLCPRDNASGAHQGKTSLSERGRPELRLGTTARTRRCLDNHSLTKRSLQAHCPFMSAHLNRGARLARETAEQERVGCAATYGRPVAG